MYDSNRRFPGPAAVLIGIAALSIFCSTARSGGGGRPEAVHHVLKVRIDHKKKVLWGDCTIEFRGAKRDKDAVLDFEFLVGKIEKVLLDGEETSRYEYKPCFGLSPELTRRYDLKRFTVTVPSRIASRKTFHLRVLYSDEEFYGTVDSPEDDKPFSLGQITASNAFSSHIHYYPFIRYAGKRGDIQLSTNLPDATAITSGELVKVTSGPSGFRTFHYRSASGSGLLPYPFAIARYGRLEKTASDGKTKLEIYFMPGGKRFAEQKMPVVQDIFTRYLELFGEYPFPKMAIVEIDLREGNIGLAAQSVIFLSRRVWFSRDLDLQRTGLTNRALYVLADEMNHQWNAYKVSTPNYLAEGISRYVDSLYGETLGGFDTLRDHMIQTASSYFHLILNTKVRDKPVTDPTVTPAIYFIKGAMALHMLRKTLGFDVFKKGLRNYFTGYAGKVTALKDFQSAFEKASGRDLTWFFKQWYNRAGWPDLSVKWSAGKDGDAWTLGVDVIQKQGLHYRLERFPIHVQYDDSKPEIRHVCIRKKKRQRIEIRLDRKPVKVLFDPDGWFLRKIKVRYGARAKSAE